MIASAWGWPPSEMRGMGVAELMDWEARARAVLEARAGRGR